jgi:hypothetical protein
MLLKMSSIYVIVGSGICTTYDVLCSRIRTVPKKQTSDFPVPASQRHPQRSQPILILCHRVRTVLQKHTSDRGTSQPQRQMQRSRPVRVPAVASAPYSRRILTTSTFPLRDAMSDGVSPGLLLCAKTSALCSRSMRTTSAWPRNDAGCNGVDLSDPVLFLGVHAPRSRSMSASSVCPLREVKCNGVYLSSSRTCTLVPRSRNKRATGT